MSLSQQLVAPRKDLSLCPPCPLARVSHGHTWFLGGRKVLRFGEAEGCPRASPLLSSLTSGYRRRFYYLSVGHPLVLGQP